MKAEGFPAYTTSAGWLGYSDDKIKRVNYTSRLTLYNKLDNMLVSMSGNISHHDITTYLTVQYFKSKFPQF